jgi:hypothetical protein
MSVVALAIHEPASGQVFLGTGAVRLRGSVVGTAPAPLFFKWYSSLEAPAPPGSPLPGSTALDFVATLSRGSHVITLAAKDVEADTVAAIRTVQHAGMAGGPVSPANPSGCVIHVLVATVVAPASGAVVSKAAGVLTAVAPRRWGRRIGATAAFEPDPDYHAINRLRYVWRFTPTGAPAGRATADLVPTLSQLRFDPGGASPTLTYAGALPAALGTGAYRMTLRVERTDDASAAHQATRSIVLAA